MRARDFIAYNKSKLKHSAIIIATLQKFADIRTDLSRTTRQYNANISDSDKWVKYVQRSFKLSVTTTKHWDFIQELRKCIATDASYIYLYSCLQKGKEIELPSADVIRERISSQYEDFPHSIIDEYLSNDINRSFAETLDAKDFTEREEIEIFNTAYVLFDEIRQDLLTPRHAAHRYKEFHCDNPSIKDEILRLLSFYIKHYDYDFSEEQRAKLDAISNSLGRYIQGRLSVKDEANGNKRKWDELKCTVDNMASDNDKKALLIEERTSYLQMSEEQQARIDPDFAKKCQLEIEKIDEIAKLRVSLQDSSHSGSSITLDQETVSKIDYYRVLNVLYEMGFFKQKDGKKLHKKEVFEQHGTFLNMDFSNFQADLGVAKATANSDMVSAYKVFDKMRKKQESLMKKGQ